MIFRDLIGEEEFYNDRVWCPYTKQLTSAIVDTTDKKSLYPIKAGGVHYTKNGFLFDSSDFAIITKFYKRLISNNIRRIYPRNYKPI